MYKSSHFLIGLGVILIAAALLLAAWNDQESREAGAASASILEELSAQQTVLPEGEGKLPDPYNLEMTEKNIGGVNCIGVLSIPVLKIELPVISQWSYPALHQAPCRFSGSTKTDDLTIAGHSYRRHFGRLGRLHPGDRVFFTDMDGITTKYQVVLTEVLAPTAVKDMTAGAYDLTLFACTFDSQNRLTVRCDRVL